MIGSLFRNLLSLDLRKCCTARQSDSAFTDDSLVAILSDLPQICAIEKLWLPAGSKNDLMSLIGRLVRLTHLSLAQSHVTYWGLSQLGALTRLR
eukprot:scaffold412031_cov45-Prasinocladus_malaysianus.AAC.1